MKILILISVLISAGAEAQAWKRKWKKAFQSGSTVPSSSSSSYSSSNIYSQPPIEKVTRTFTNGYRPDSPYMKYYVKTRYDSHIVSKEFYDRCNAYLKAKSDAFMAAQKKKAEAALVYATTPPAANLVIQDDDSIAPWEQDSIPLDGKLRSKIGLWMYEYEDEFSFKYEKTRYNGQKDLADLKGKRHWKCAHMSNYFSFGKFDCRYVVLAVDIENATMIVKVDMWGQTKDTKTEHLLGSYFAEMKGENEDFTIPLMERLPKNKRLNSLASAINSLNFGKVRFYQNNFKVGKITLSPLGSLMINPLRDERMLDFYDIPLRDGTVGYRKDKFWKISDQPKVFDFDSTYGLKEKFDDIQILFKSIEQTGLILSNAKKDLMAKPLLDEELDLDGVLDFKKKIAENSATISKEFKEMRRLINVMNFHPMEVSYFVGSIQKLVYSVDGILEDLKNTPDHLRFMNIINLN